MAIKPSGPLALSEIAAEFGVGAPMSLSQFYRGGGIVPNNPQNQNVPTGGSISFSNFYNATRAYQIDITTNRENLNLFDLFAGTYGNPGGLPVIVTFIIHGGVTIGGTYGAWALWVGQFPAGSDITINNYGSILGHYGERNSGGGGSCIYGAFGSQRMVFNNYGVVYAGGGGGGVGGPGGQGGPGYYINTSMVGQSGNVASGQGQPILCRTAVMDCNGACRNSFGGNARCESLDYGVCNPGVIDGSCIYCKRCYVDDRIDTSGGGGGGGGAGGYGQGYGVGRTGGDPGGGGSPGGQNAGYGGSGGYGGTGGDWGQYGGGGNTGDTGGGGNAGGGSPGGGGAGGGPPGNYLVRGGAEFYFNNAGSIAGGEG